MTKSSTGRFASIISSAVVLLSTGVVAKAVGPVSSEVVLPVPLSDHEVSMSNVVALLFILEHRTV